MTKYSDNLTVADVEAVLRALPDHEITGDEIAMIISEIALRFCGNSLEALLIMGGRCRSPPPMGPIRTGR